MSYSHRLATQEDLPSIVEIYNSAVLARSSTCDLEPVSVASRQAWFDDARPDRHPIWVGYKPDDPRTVTGYLSLEPFLNGRRGYDATLDLAVYLHPDHRGRGQGRYLLCEAITHAPKLGARTLATTIFASNEPSIRLFHSLGFQVWGRLPGVADLDGVIHDVVFVGRRVDNVRD
ncbi:GNAT family N-acetyltransferase [Kibdelosporangium aridum]|uniref:GNAT family N-acetyltransferase n=1 Tax=Kibdelosporangium aridum TaxID=2030 RepID=A0A428XXE7_KIBAR|nr:GNAT family N-acetyltransferase [Kibdelosporangium aridum]RSM60019.1 GNAT family N-acetyltransferase [Kibdelosporangium aridum]